MTARASQITSLTIVYWTVYSGADKRKHQSSAPLAFVRGIHRWPVNFPHKGPVTRKILPFDDVIMAYYPLVLVYMLLEIKLFCYRDAGLSRGCPEDVLTNSCNIKVLLYCTEALKGHRVVWKIEIYYLIRMTYEWKPMSSRWHNNIVVTHPDEIPISAKSSGWHTVVWYVIRMTYCSVQKLYGWDAARS